VDLFGLVSWSLVLVVAVTLCWPVNIPLLALAYKVRLGRERLPIKPGELWLRCGLGALGLCLLSLLLVGLVYGGVVMAEISPGPVELMLLVAYVAAAVAFLFWTLALEDMMQALSVFLLYILLPGLPLLLVGRFTGLWQALRKSAAWLLLPS
jgi:hypothetical protein